MGVEPTTFRLQGGCSPKMSYRPIFMLINLSFVSILLKFMCDREELNLLSIFGDPYRT